MAIDRTGISSLDAGASDITYSGNEGPKSPQEIQQMQQQEMAGGENDRVRELLQKQETIGLSEDEKIELRELIKTISARRQQEEGGIGNMAMKSGLIDDYRNYKMQQEEIDPSKLMSPRDWHQSEYGAARAGVAYGGTARPTYTQDRKQRLANGGITQLVKPGPGRPGYGGPGSWFQEYIKDPIEMAITGKTQAEIDAESQARVDREEAGLPEGESYTPWYEQIFSPTVQKLTQDTASDFGLGDLAQNIGLGDLTRLFGQPNQETGSIPFGMNWANLPEGLKPYMRKMIKEGVAAVPATQGEYKYPGPGGGEPVFIQGTPAQQAIAPEYEHKLNPVYPISMGLAAGQYAKAHPGPTLPAETAIGARNIDMAAAKRGDDLRFGLDPSLRAASGGIARLAQGGRIRAQEGGLMNLGGMEKDYRQEGGFVPIGGQEKADDVPARLSKNEFVFTADAVRAAGGGDIDAGAEVMENVMNNLEQGGQISEESQGLEGARDMFATAQRLEGVM